MKTPRLLHEKWKNRPARVFAQPVARACFRIGASQEIGYLLITAAFISYR